VVPYGDDLLGLLEALTDLPPGGRPLDGEGTPVGHCVDVFFRSLGDSDGNRDVDEPDRDESLPRLGTSLEP
jgi:hypothetical protein